MLSTLDNMMTIMLSGGSSNSCCGSPTNVVNDSIQGRKDENHNHVKRGRRERQVERFNGLETSNGSLFSLPIHRHFNHLSVCLSISIFDYFETTDFVLETRTLLKTSMVRSHCSIPSITSKRQSNRQPAILVLSFFLSIPRPRNPPKL